MHKYCDQDFYEQQQDGNRQIVLIEFEHSDWLRACIEIPFAIFGVTTKKLIARPPSVTKILKNTNQRSKNGQTAQVIRYRNNGTRQIKLWMVAFLHTLLTQPREERLNILTKLFAQVGLKIRFFIFH
jgi:hypothetical protein